MPRPTLRGDQLSEFFPADAFRKRSVHDPNRTPDDVHAVNNRIRAATTVVSLREECVRPCLLVAKRLGALLVRRSR
jgi:hypothetical protein